MRPAIGCSADSVAAMPAGVPPERMQHARHRQQVVDVEATQQRRAHWMRFVADGQVEGDAGAVEHHADRAHGRIAIAARAGAHARQATGQAVVQLAAEGIVDVDHRRLQPGPREQLRLGRAIGRHVAVVVEVVAGEVGEHADAEVHAVHAALVERVRSDFHRHRARAGIAQLGQQRIASAAPAAW